MVIQQGKYAGRGGDIVRYEGDHKYVVRMWGYVRDPSLRYVKLKKKVLCPRSLFLSTGELIGPLFRKVGKRDTAGIRMQGR